MRISVGANAAVSVGFAVLFLAVFVALGLEFVITFHLLLERLRSAVASVYIEVLKENNVLFRAYDGFDVVEVLFLDSLAVGACVGIALGALSLDCLTLFTTGISVFLAESFELGFLGIVEVETCEWVDSFRAGLFVTLGCGSTA